MTALKWRRAEKVEGYESGDGRWVIEHAEGLTYCDNPHPRGKGKPRCEGGEEHAYRFWVLWDERWGQGLGEVDSGDTLRAMKATAETIVARERAVS